LKVDEQGIRIKTQVEIDSNPELMEFTNYSSIVQKSQTKTLALALKTVLHVRHWICVSCAASSTIVSIRDCASAEYIDFPNRHGSLGIISDVQEVEPEPASGPVILFRRKETNGF
jgi:hypothetical protein